MFETKSRAVVRCFILLSGTLLMHPSIAKAEPTESTLAQIRRFNPWLSADEPLELPLKLHSLLKGEYTFFRGTVDLYYDWCRENCADWMKSKDHSLFLHGDIHLGNIGTYRARDPVNRFAVVDLDETFTGPYQLDLLRGFISIRLAASDNHIELPSADRAALLDHYIASYSDALTGRVSSDDLAKRHVMVKSLLKKASAGDAAELADKFCKGKPPRQFRPARIKKGRVSDIMTPVDEKTRQAVAEAVIEFASKESVGFSPSPRPKQPVDEKDILDVVQWSRIDSGGSQGVRKYLVLIAPDDAWEGKPLLLQLKEEPPPAAVRAGLIKDTPGAQRAAQVATTYLMVIDPLPWLVGHAEVDGRGYLIRTKDPFSEEPEADDFKTMASLKDGARLLGETLGHAHRAGLRVHLDRDKVATARAGELKALTPKLAERSEAILAHLHRAFVNLQQDEKAHAMVKEAKRRIEAAAKVAND